MKFSENIFLAIFLIIVLGMGYFWYAHWRQPVVTEQAAGGIDSFFVGQEFLVMIAQIKSINFDVSILQSKLYSSLTDTTPIEEAPSSVGKKNPFLPFSPSSSKSKTAD